MKKTLKKNKKGFTLIEIIVVLVIMGILLAIAVPSVMGYVNQANEAKYIAQARNGFLAANTINAKNVAGGETNDGKLGTAIDLTAVNTELTGSDNAITSITCTVTGKKVATCSIGVKDLANKTVEFVSDKDAKIVPVKKP